MTLLPAEPDSGILFRRKDLEADQADIKASWRNLVDTALGTVLGNDSGHIVSAVDLVLAALRGCGVDNVIVETSGSELPAFDGSSAPLVALINRAGLTPQTLPRPGIWIERSIEVRLGEAYAILNPASVPRITVNLEPRDAAVDSQCVSLELVDHIFAREIAPARGLGMDQEPSGFFADTALSHDTIAPPAMMHDRLKPGNWRLRYRDEAARHKMLQCFGDLSLAGAPLFGHLFVHQPSHRLNHALLRTLFDHRQAWSRLSYDSIQRRAAHEHGELAIRAKLSSMRPH